MQAAEQPTLDPSLVRVLAFTQSEPGLIWVYELKRLGAEVVRAFDAGQTLELLREQSFQAVFFDADLLPENPSTFLDAAQEAAPYAPCYAVCKELDGRRQVRLIESGCFDCLVRPFDVIRLWITLRNGLEWGRQRHLAAVRPYVDTQRPAKTGQAIRESLHEIETYSIGETLTLADRQVERFLRNRQRPVVKKRKYRIR